MRKNPGRKRNGEKKSWERERERERVNGKIEKSSEKSIWLFIAFFLPRTFGERFIMKERERERARAHQDLHSLAVFGRVYSLSSQDRNFSGSVLPKFRRSCLFFFPFSLFFVFSRTLVPSEFHLLIRKWRASICEARGESLFPITCDAILSLSLSARHSEIFCRRK